MALFFRCILPFIFLSQLMAATIVGEMNEVRLAKIELAIEDKDYKEALKLIRKNLDSGEMHVPTYFLLARYHMEKGKYSKAMRVYYYVIKKIHAIDGKKVILQRSESDLDQLLENISVPTNKALEVYMEVGKTFYSIADSFEHKKEFRSQLYLHAKKFFKVCEQFRYDLASSKFFIGLINTKIQNTIDAIGNFYDAKELLIAGKADPNEIKKVNYLLAESLIREGRTDAGTIYLKTITRDENVEASLKRYAEIYLSGIKTSYSTLSFGIDYKYKSNINSLNSEDLATLTEEDYITKDGTTVNKNVGVAFSSGQVGNFTYRTSFSISDEKNNNRQLVTLDSRSYGGYLTVKYNNFVKSILTFDLGYGQEYSPISAESGQKKTSATTSLDLGYLYNIKSGTMSYKTSIRYLESESEEKPSINKGITITYSPFWNTKILSPSYSVGATSVDEGEGKNSSLRYDLSINNSSTITNDLSIFTYLAYSQNSNTDPDLGYTDFDLGVYFTYYIRYFSGLSLDASMSQSLSSTDSGKSTKKFESSLGLTYSF